MNRREFLTASTFAAIGGWTASDTNLASLNPISSAFAQDGGPKPPTQHTLAINKKVLEELPFNDRTDFELAQRGFIAGLPDGVIKDPDGKIAFDAKKFAIPLDQPPPDTWNPSLWRVSQLDGLSGLFKVVDRLYQLRSLDVANMTIMEGDTGLIIIDCCGTVSAARAGLDLYYQHRPKKPIVAIIMTHSHIDHFGGIGGVATAEDVAAGKIKVIAPAGFTEEAVSENLYAGNAMIRRSSYQYGMVLPKGPDGTLGSGLGISGADDPPTLIVPTAFITKTGEKMTIDGLEFEFLMAPGSEAPSEMHFYTPALKALCTAENACHTLHNFYTLRGAKTRDISKWVKYLNQTLDMWGDQAEVLYAPHQWPVWGNAEINDHIEKYRDVFKFIHDRSLHLANSGYTMPEIGTMVELPPELANNWATRGYYGTVSHNSRAVYNFYLGYYSGNPAELNPLSPKDAAPRYVEMMGGADAIVGKAREAYEKGEYRWVAQLLEHVVYAEPNNLDARNLQADAFDQLAYQSEAATWRNFYTMGAVELRKGVPEIEMAIGTSPDLVKNIPLEMTFDYLGIALDAEKAAGKTIKINFEVDGTGEKRSLVLRNSVLNSRTRLDPSPDATLKASGAVLNAVLMGGDPTKAGEMGGLTIEGRKEALTDLLSTIGTFKFWFPIVTRPT
ncbi:alkyl/aryl-sulfatase [Rhizobium mesosinicum]|uniref:MBL fold metallo-hydrolase n=1 Tax=Rhizobium mesosinicum TaxID=335017 RepID=A0ABS7GX76_9HYPH|nr:alkyl sulfatase dimerization domain-containing protein [Rhizobium mesosinicum]MBW9054539.1 MBL fold metallo-hydrolase [Rhizobium mesosinicum]